MIEFRNVSYTAEDGNEIIKDVSFKLDERFVVITGPNGSGKSTIARLIAGIIKPTSGRIFLDGKDITDFTVTERAKEGISYGFQQPVRFKGLTVKDLLSLAAGKKLTTAEACTMLAKVGLCARDYVGREANASLSGGELKRIEIAMVMARNTRYSVFDEPEAGIDLWSFNNLINVFKELHENTQGTIIIISHQERILKLADRILVIAGGKVTADGEGEELYKEIQTPGCIYYRKGD
ncbi:MAG: ATP-binding cassette domain-containing protein [Clostridia bacterium]|nr:ATP-binding cassette domain-containing protein [Clostridia bacterium]